MKTMNKTSRRGEISCIKGQPPTKKIQLKRLLSLKMHWNEEAVVLRGLNN